MAPSKVQCPICNRSVSESDINLHLDLQCPGPGAASSPVAARSSSPAPSGSLGMTKKNKLPSQKGTISSQLSNGSDMPEPIEPPPSSASLPRKSSLNVRWPASAGNNTKRAAGNDTKNGQPTDDSKDPKRRRVNPLQANQPLAERSRPTSLAAYVGQDDLVGPGSLLRARIEKGEGVGSCILWGPPGSGKTTLARLIARTANADFKELSATSSGAADVRQVFEQAKNGLVLTGRKTILMVDEIHRFNKPQQDLFLPYVENGWVQLIGATTENPSFKVNGALLSRCQVFTLSAHTPEDLEKILNNAIEAIPDPRPYLPPQLVPFLAEVADGDARQALNGLELALKVCDVPLSMQTKLNLDGTGEVSDEARQTRDKQIMEAVRRGLRKGYDRSGEERYDMISALHKCIRGSDGSAAMYWLARMLTGGEDPLYIARRLVVLASEDVGLADNHALPLAMSTYQACQVIGMPECRINLAHLVAYLSEAPKSTRSYTAYKRAEILATKPPLPGVPMQIRNAPTKLMSKLGYGKGYSYQPDFAHPTHNDYLPTELAHHSSHDPADPHAHILKTPEYELLDKDWDEWRLQEWEAKVNGDKPWPGRVERQQKIDGNESVPQSRNTGRNSSKAYTSGTEHVSTASRRGDEE